MSLVTFLAERAAKVALIAPALERIKSKVLNKKIEQRQETVADTVRRTKVKIEDDRKDASTDRR